MRGSLIGPVLLGQRGLLIAFAVTTLGRTLLSMASIFLIRDFLGGVLGDAPGAAGALADRFGSGPALWMVAALLVGTYLGASLFKYHNLVTEQRILRAVEMRVLERIVRHLLLLSVPFLESRSQGDLIQTVRTDVAQLRTIVVARLAMVLDGVLALGLLVAAFLISPLTFVVLVILAFAGLPVVWISKRTLVLSWRMRRASAVLYEVLLELVRGIRVIRVYRGEEAVIRRALDRTRIYFTEYIAAVRVHALAQAVLESFTAFSLVAVILVGGFQVMDGRLAWPELLAFLMAVAALHRPLSEIGNRFLTVRRLSASVERIESLLGEAPLVAERPHAVPFPGEPGSLRFHGVGFGYADGGDGVLRDVSFEVRRGETVGIVGPSGAGKTTLLGLAARFRDPDHGRIEVDGRDLRDYRLDSLYGNLAFVGHESFLFAETARENIRLGRPEATDAEVEAAARGAHIHEEILALSGGYDTRLGDGGRRLSAGQAQRIGIARALLRDAPLLLLDEATSSLDSISEARVQQALERLTAGRSTLVVAHRLSTLRGATRILVLDGGTVAAQGTHEELLEASPTYREMWERQRLEEAGG